MLSGQLISIWKECFCWIPPPICLCTWSWPHMTVYSVLTPYACVLSPDPICPCTQTWPHITVYSILTPYNRVLGPDSIWPCTWSCPLICPCTRSLDRYWEVTEMFNTWNFVGILGCEGYALNGDCRTPIFIPSSLNIMGWIAYSTTHSCHGVLTNPQAPQKQGWIIEMSKNRAKPILLLL